MFEALRNRNFASFWVAAASFVAIKAAATATLLPEARRRWSDIPPVTVRAGSTT